jgi:hypothetical protein
MNNENFVYEPGVCNIDIAGVRTRKRLGNISLVTGIICMTVLYIFHFGMPFRFIIGAGFGYIVALNFLQAKEHFCVMNARRRTVEIGLRAVKITDDSKKELDLKKMRRMIGMSLLYALAGGCLGLMPL